jgi:hypothetical protein
MVDPEILEQVKEVIDSIEAKARTKIEGTGSYYVEPHTGKSVYSHALDAVSICRGAAGRVNTSQEELGYLIDVLRNLERARELYVETSSDDEDGYGNATFHMIIREISTLYEGLDAITEFVNTQAALVSLEND